MGEGGEVDHRMMGKAVKRSTNRISILNCNEHLKE